MLRTGSVLLLVAGFTAAAVCLYGSRTAPGKPSSAESPQAVTAKILRLEEGLDDAESHHRVAAVEDLIADDYVGITVGGGVIRKRDVLKAVGGTEEASSQSSDRQVRPLENAAVYTALVLDRGIEPNTGKSYILASRVMDIWEKRGGEWKLVNDQATGVNVGDVAQ